MPRDRPTWFIGYTYTSSLNPPPRTNFGIEQKLLPSLLEFLFGQHAVYVVARKFKSLKGVYVGIMSSDLED